MTRLGTLSRLGLPSAVGAMREENVTPVEWIALGAMLGLLALSAYFSGSEAALFSLTRLERHRMQGRPDRPSRRILALLEDSNQTLATLLVANNFVNIALSSIATVFFIALLGEARRGEAVEISSLVIAFFVLIFGEITPKTLAVNAALRVARRSAAGLQLTHRISLPVTRLFHYLAVRILCLLGRDEGRAGGPVPLISRSELHAVLEDVDESEAVITRNESRMVQNILGFSRRTAEQIMTPRVDIVDLDVAAPSAQITAEMRASRHSRFPVYQDDPDNIIGFVQGKEYLLNPDRSVRERLRPVVFFPEAAPVDRIFSEIQSSRKGMVIVVNEFGEVAGLITREDVIEEIVGDIYDEFDREEVPIRDRGEGKYICLGRADLSDLNEELGLDLPAESSVTLNGFLCEVHGRIPRPGTIVTWKNLRFHVMEVARHQVRKALLEITERSEGDER